MRRARLLPLILLITPLVAVYAQTPAPSPAQPTKPATASPQQRVVPSEPGASRPAMPGSSPQQVPPPGPPTSAGAAQSAEVAQQAAAVEEDPDWAVTLERIANSVVSIEVDQTRAFDTEWNASAQATGFVVDAERGLILTNRHVVTPGPVTSEATFLNREEVQLYPVYRDPVHDFGIYRYDPSKLRFIKPKALPLFPEGAQVGREIRVVGNNAGEQLSILAGTLAKLDRAAPEYGIAKYNDFNTFYLQAASGTSGGSSGSPVVDIRGRVVALNAGGANSSASSFYLPLGRVKRALELIQQGKTPSRGTLQTVFTYTPYDELRRLGLNATTETMVRKAYPSYTGMLVVSEVLPGSASDASLQPGDILVKVNGKFVTQFEPLDDLMDSNVGKTVDVELERGGKPVSAKIAVTDLHSITPSSYLEFGDAIVHTLSYQQARHFNVAVKGAYVANPGYVFGAGGVPRGAVISSFNSKDINTVDELETALNDLSDGERASVRFSTIDDPNGSQLRSVRIDRRWFPGRHCVRDDKQGIWDCKQLAAAPPPKPEKGGSTEFPTFKDPRLAYIVPSLVQVSFDMPYSVSGITERNYHGTGLVLDAQRGLVVVDRNTVPVSVGDVSVTFAGTLQVPARVKYVHPLHNLALIEYDPKLIGATPVKSARLAPRDIVPGEQVWVVGLGGDSEVKSRSTEIAEVEPILLPLSRTMRFRDSNIEGISLVNPPLDYDGVLLEKSGRVIGLWSSFAYENGRELTQDNRGVPIDVVDDMLRRVQNNSPLHSLEVEFATSPIASAREFGLTDEWTKKLAQHSPSERQVLTAVRMVGGSAASRLLQQGDLVLAIDDQVVTRFREVERAVADKKTVKVTVWRGKAERSFDVETAELPSTDIDRLVQWGGATLQAPHRAMAAQRGIPPTGVYVGYFAYGSPATRYGLYPGRRIVEVDGVPTPDLDAFLTAVTGRPDRSSVRLKTITWNNAPEVITLKLDKHYWPAYELVRSANGWERRALE